MGVMRGPPGSPWACCKLEQVESITRRMTEPFLQLDMLTPDALQVLEAYSLRATAAKCGEQEFDGWLDRIDSMPDLTTDDLVKLHGRLIALGYLKFEISGRNVGLRYQISSAGRQAIERARLQNTNEDVAA